MFQYRYRNTFFSFVYLRNIFKILCNILEHIAVSEENHLALVSERMELSVEKMHEIARTNLSLYLFAFELFLVHSTRERVYLRHTEIRSNLYDLYERIFFFFFRNWFTDCSKESREKKKKKKNTTWFLLPFIHPSSDTITTNERLGYYYTRRREGKLGERYSRT